jgi:hypothetical protein
VGDTVSVVFPSLIQVSGALSGAPFIGIAVIVQPAVGVIQTGSTKCTIGG